LAVSKFTLLDGVTGWKINNYHDWKCKLHKMSWLKWGNIILLMLNIRVKL
jgi:hypothetical protein